MYIMPAFCLCWIRVLSQQPENGNIRIIIDVVDWRFGYEYGLPFYIIEVDYNDNTDLY